jgi:hypothetical protein
LSIESRRKNGCAFVGLPSILMVKQADAAVIKGRIMAMS